MSFDTVFIALIVLVALLGLRAGFVRSAIGAAALAIAAFVGATAGSSVTLISVGLWLLLALGFALVWPADGPSWTSRLTGSFLGAGQGAAAIVLLSGALLTSVYADRPEPAEHLRQASVYEAVVSLARATNLDRTALLFPASLEPRPEQTHTAHPTIDWAEARPFTTGAVRELPGEVRALDRTSLAFEVGGRVTSVAVDIGDHFAAGDVLAQLDTHLLEIGVQERRAALIEAEARLSEARQEYERQTTLFERNVVSESAVETVAAALDSARSRYEIALRGIETAEDRLEDATLRAPYDGSVAVRRVEPAQTVSAGTPVLEIQSNGGGFEVTATVPDTVVARLSLGTEHAISALDGSGQTYVGVLDDIGTRATSTSGFPVTLRVSQTDTSLRSGLSVEVAFRLDGAATDAARIAVPVSAVWSDADQGHGVFVVDPETQQLAARSVTLAGTESGVALVSDGLQAGELVATRGIAFLEDGMAVHLRGIGTARYDQ